MRGRPLQGSAPGGRSGRSASPSPGVGGELVAAAVVELLHRADQPERPFLDQVEEGEPAAEVVLRDRYDQSKVRLDHLLLRAHVAALDALGEDDLLLGSQEINA